MKSRGMVCLLSMAVGLSSLSYGAQADRVQGALAGPTVALPGNVHRLALPQFDQGGVDPAMQLGTITLMTAPTVAQEQALKQLLAQQQDPKSSNYHKWLTPEQFASRFGLSQNDIQQITAWLESEGFTNVHPARGRNWVSFTGTAGQVESALGTSIHHYNVNGKMHYANATAPMIPQALSGIVTGFRGLTDFKPHPMNAKRTRPLYYDASFQSDFLAPGDIATIYDINTLYNSGIDGTGQKLAVMGQTEIYLADLNDFRSGFGLSTLSCTTDGNGLITACNDPHFKYVLDGSAPLSTNGDISESDLDLEWSGAVARNAQIIFVDSSDTFTSYYYAIDQDLAPVISLSYGFCELDDNTLSADEGELQKANSEGITFVNSSGDSGAAECDYFATVTSTNLATQGLAVSYPASSPEVTGAGGTGMVYSNWATNQGFGTTNGSNGGSATGYVSEQAWNDDYEISQYCLQNTASEFCLQGGSTKQSGWVKITSEATAQTDIGISSTGGGASNCTSHNAGNTVCNASSGFAKPSWQTVTVAGQTTRLSPDISFYASPNFPGYIFCTPQSELSTTTSSTSTCYQGIQTAVETYTSIIGGTSASAPVFAGMVALLNQYTASAGQGNINPSLYQLAAVAPSAFHDVTAGDNKVYCQPGTPTGQLSSLLCPSSGVVGYSASTGFDLATGLGSLDLNNFAVALKTPPDFSGTSSATALTLWPSQSGTSTITITPINNFTGTVGFSCTGPSGTSCTFSPSTVTPNGAAVTTTATITAGSTAGNVVINATTGSLSQLTHQAGSVALSVNSGTFSLQSNLSGGTLTVSQGQTGTIDLTVTSSSNPSFIVPNGSGGQQTALPVSYSCTGLPSGAVCTFNPFSTTQSISVTLALSTSAPTTKLQNPLDRGGRIFYAVLLPGLLGVFFTIGSRKRTWSGMRALGLILVLGASTIWMGSCGGSSSGAAKNLGTPTGSYSVVVNATTGGSAPIATSLPFTFTVTP
ncbi:MAG TPA: S53 family peptidase [Candidatus Acidoferrum sp.]|nr:S53 family peptidase [Candidatus Acidoferrum sp.]